MSFKSFIHSKLKSYSKSDPTIAEVNKYIDEVKSEMIKIHNSASNFKKFNSIDELDKYLSDYPIDDFITSISSNRSSKELAELIMYTP